MNPLRLLIDNTEQEGDITRVYSGNTWIDLWVTNNDPCIGVGDILEITLISKITDRSRKMGFMSGMVYNCSGDSYYVSFGGLLGCFPNDYCLSTPVLNSKVYMEYDYWTPRKDQATGT
jgi:hypothetical protein